MQKPLAPHFPDAHSLSFLRNLESEHLFGASRSLQLLEAPFQNDRAEITQASSFFGSVFFQLFPAELG